MNPSSSMYKKGLIVLVLGIMILSVGSGQKVLLNDTFDNNIDGWYLYSYDSAFGDLPQLSHDSANNKYNVNSNYNYKAMTQKEIPSYNDIGTDSYYNISYETYWESSMDGTQFRVWDSNNNSVINVKTLADSSFDLNGNPLDSVFMDNGNYYNIELIGINESDNTIKEIKHDGSTIKTNYNLDSSLDLSDIRYVGAGFLNEGESATYNMKTDDVVVSTKVTNVNPVFNELNSTPPKTEWIYGSKPDIYYNVSDDDGNLDKVNLTVTKDQNYYSHTVVDVSGSEATGTVNDLFTIDSRDTTWGVEAQAIDTQGATSNTELLAEYIPPLEFENQLDVSLTIENGSTVSRGDMLRDVLDVEFTMNEQIKNSRYNNIYVMYDNEIEKTLTDFNMEVANINISDLAVGKTVRRTYDFDTTDIDNQLWSEIEENNSDVGVSVNMILEDVNSSGDVQDTGDTYIGRNNGVFRYFESFGDSGVLYEVGRNIVQWTWNVLLEPVLNPILELLEWVWSGIIYILLFILDLLVLTIGMILQVLLWVIGAITTGVVNGLQFWLFYHVDIGFNYTVNNTTTETYNNFNNLTEEQDMTFIEAIGSDITVIGNRTQMDVFNERYGLNSYPLLEYKRDVVLYEYNYTVFESTRDNVTEENVKTGDKSNVQ